MVSLDASLSNQVHQKSRVPREEVERSGLCVLATVEIDTQL